MKLLRFRIQNYKTIQDSGWIRCDAVTAFVGKNEAGKTSLLRALSKLKSTDATKYDPIKEFPHGRYTDEFTKQDWPVASAEFQLDEDERGELTSICESLEDVTKVLVTRHYSDKITVGFDPDHKPTYISYRDWSQFLKDVTKAAERALPDVSGQTPEQAEETKSKWQNQKQTIVSLCQKRQTEADTSKVGPKKDIVAGFEQTLIANTTDAWSRNAVSVLIEKLDQWVAEQEKNEQMAEARQWVSQNIPSFLFFSNYEMLQSAIYLPDFISQGKGDRRKDADFRVQQALFKHVGVDANELSKLSQGSTEGNDQTIRRRIDELTIKANSASEAMTRKFSEWWLQRNHKFHYEFNGHYFRVWVTDNLNPSKVEFEERSEGFRYFFSFYLLFLVEAEGNHKDCILLLDEPGLHLHGSAQAKLLEFFDKLSSEGNQVLYSTHSPFLIDGSHLERARAVFDKSGQTVVSDDVWPKDTDSLFPLQAALGYSACQSLFLSKKQVLVEGPTDYMLLLALNVALPESDRLQKDITMLAVGAASNLAPFAALLSGHGVKFIAIPDNDQPGKDARKSLFKLQELIGRKAAVAFGFDELSGRSEVNELEGLIPERYFLAVAQTIYPKADFKFTPEQISEVPSIVQRCKHRVIEATGSKFDKLAIIQQIVLQLHSKSSEVPSELLETAKSIFDRLNKAF